MAWYYSGKYIFNEKLNLTWNKQTNFNKMCTPKRLKNLKTPIG